MSFLFILFLCACLPSHFPSLPQILYGRLSSGQCTLLPHTERTMKLWVIESCRPCLYYSGANLRGSLYRSRGDSGHCTAFSTLPQVLALLKLVDSLFNLGSQIRAVECGLMNNSLARRAIPAKSIEALCRSLLFNNDPNLQALDQYFAFPTAYRR